MIINSQLQMLVEPTEDFNLNFYPRKDLLYYQILLLIYFFHIKTKSIGFVQ